MSSSMSRPYLTLCLGGLLYIDDVNRWRCISSFCFIIFLRDYGSVRLLSRTVVYPTLCILLLYKIKLVGRSYIHQFQMAIKRVTPIRFVWRFHCESPPPSRSKCFYIQRIVWVSKSSKVRHLLFLKRVWKIKKYINWWDKARFYTRDHHHHHRKKTQKKKIVCVCKMSFQMFSIHFSSTLVILYRRVVR